MAQGSCDGRDVAGVHCFNMDINEGHNNRKGNSIGSVIKYISRKGNSIGSSI